MIVYFSDFDLKGSGYKNIGVPLCQGLSDRGMEVLVCGLGYHGEPHEFGFGICPTKFPNIPNMMKVLPTAQDKKIEAWVTAFDIPLQIGLLNQTPDHGGIPWVSIFPIEGDPLCEFWAMKLLEFDRHLVLSEFGTQESKKAGLVDAVHLEVGIDLEEWKPPTSEERTALRESLDLEEKFVVLTVADNQERKNLSRSMEVFGEFAKTHNTTYLMVTREWSPVGWVLREYANDLGFADRFFVWERGITQPRLRDLYAMADCFLLSSKAEGLGMPILEAMAMKVPVVATNCCAITDHLKDHRGLLVEPDYVFVDPWGNSRRYMMSVDMGVDALVRLVEASEEQKDRLKEKALDYVRKRTWKQAVDIFEEVINNAIQDG